MSEVPLYLAHTKLPPPSTLQQTYAQAPMVVLGGGAVPHERGTPEPPLPEHWSGPHSVPMLVFKQSPTHQIPLVKICWSKPAGQTPAGQNTKPRWSKPPLWSDPAGPDRAVCERNRDPGRSITPAGGLSL